MIRRRVRLWALWLLPLIAARALVPTGFMVSVQADGLALTFCSGVASAHFAAAAVQSGAHEAHAHHDAMQSGSTTAAAEAPCPFALLAAAPSSSVPRFDACIPEADVLLPDLHAPFSDSGPPRTDRARGPPARFIARIV